MQMHSGTDPTVHLNELLFHKHFLTIYDDYTFPWLSHAHSLQVVGEGAIRGHPSCVEKRQNTHRCMFWRRMK